MNNFFQNNITIILNTLGVIVGIIVGGILNGLVLQLGYKFIPPAPEFNHAIAETYKFLKPVNYLGPFFAHAVHSFVGAFIACKIGVSNHKRLAMIIGIFVLSASAFIGFTYPIPTWFTILDLSIASIPCAIMGWHLATKK